MSSVSSKIVIGAIFSSVGGEASKKLLVLKKETGESGTNLTRLVNPSSNSYKISRGGKKIGESATLFWCGLFLASLLFLFIVPGWSLDVIIRTGIYFVLCWGGIYFGYRKDIAEQLEAKKAKQMAKAKTDALIQNGYPLIKGMFNWRRENIWAPKAEAERKRDLEMLQYCRWQISCCPSPKK